MNHCRVIQFHLLFTALIFAQSPYKCGEKQILNRSYGTIELRVNCEYRTDNILSLLEYKGKVQHGFQLDYDTLWRKRDSCFFVNGKENGLCLYWDTLGNVVGREKYRGGKYIGKRERFFAPGRPSLIKNYNTKGEEDGPWEEWWKNGNKKAEFIAKKGHIISGKEYYQDGKPRVQYTTKDEPRKKNYLETKYVQAESWAPNGKPAGRITKGDGEWTVFPDGRDSANHPVFREVYKDSLLVKVTKVDSAEVARWMAR